MAVKFEFEGAGVFLASIGFVIFGFLLWDSSLQGANTSQKLIAEALDVLIFMLPDRQPTVQGSEPSAPKPKLSLSNFMPSNCTNSRFDTACEARPLGSEMLVGSTLNPKPQPYIQNLN